MTNQPLSLARPRAAATPVAIAAAASAAAIVALRLAILFRFRIDSDETQHLHVAWGWSHGLVQYRDLFDNHMPLFHLLSAPLVWLAGERPEALIAGRLAMLPLFALIVMLTYRIAASCYEARAAGWAAAVGALVPVFFLCSVEFRPDVLWAAFWLAALYVLVRPAGVPPADPAASRRRRCVAAGLFIGLATAVSAKTSLLAVSLIAALLLTRERPKNIASLVGVALVPPSLIAIWYAAIGAWDAFVTGTITHNLVASEHPHRIAFIVPSVAIIAWVTRRLAREDVEDEVRRRRVFLFLAASIYGALLISFWPIIEREHWLPFHPAFAAAVVPPFLGRRPRLVIALIAVELLRIVALAKPWIDATGPAMNAIAQTLRLTAPHERVVDLKGDLVFRRRASYAVFEKITKKAISTGRMPDTIEADVLRTHAMVATPDDPSFPRSGRAFLLRNFIDAGAVRVAGKHVHGIFRIEVPGEYAVVSSNGTFTGALDGTPYTDPRYLGRGTHTITGDATLIWSHALGGSDPNQSLLLSFAEVVLRIEFGDVDQPEVLRRRVHLRLHLVRLARVERITLHEYHLLMPSARVRIFCPNIRTLPNESARDRAMRLVRDIDAAADANVEIFLAPEYYFTHNTKDLPDPHKCIAYTAGEADTVRAIIARQSGEVTPHMLIVAGSMFMVQGVYDPHIFNTSFVYLDGGKVAECSKFDRAADATYAHECGRAFFPGETGTQFTFNGITCYLQICTDTTNAPPSTLNLSIVPAYIPGAAALANRASFDYRILSDGAGRYAFIDHGAGKGGPGPFYDCEVAV